jgi:hypothetical protein
MCTLLFREAECKDYGAGRTVSFKSDLSKELASSLSYSQTRLGDLSSRFEIWDSYQELDNYNGSITKDHIKPLVLQ